MGGYRKESAAPEPHWQRFQNNITRCNELVRFTEGYFTARPSDVFFLSGIFSNQEIKQILMKTMSAKGGRFYY